MVSFITWLVSSPILWRHQRNEKKSKFGRNFRYEGVMKYQKPAIMLNNFLLAFKIWKQNAKTPSSSKVIDIWGEHTFLAIFSNFDIIFQLSDDVIKKWKPFWKFFCHQFVHIMSSYKCAKFHTHILFLSEIMWWGGQWAPPSVFHRTKKARYS